MAPRPKELPTMALRISGRAGSPNAVYHPPISRADRLMREKHIRQIQSGGITKATRSKRGNKRRRPGKKLIAAEDMDDMRDALPDLSGDDEGDEWEGFSGEESAAQQKAGRRRKRTQNAEGKIQMRSLKHRPGAMKRKRRMEGVEMERFGRNLAQLSANTQIQGEDANVKGGEGAGDAGRSGALGKEKWAALRSFIGSTMEKKGEFR